MRRDTIDSGSQPVRNLVLNPDMERVSGTTAVRQNLAAYPSMEAAGASVVVRQNLMGNPRGVFAMSQYSTAGAQVITPNVAITGHPEGITTANRFTYGGTTPSNPGVQFFNGTPGTNYTMSAWIYIESLCTTPGTTGWAESGVLSGPNFANTVGVWQKVVWNRTPTSGNGIGIRTAAADGGSASILITGIVIEAAPVGYASTTFFDGNTAASGDFTYTWAGTPNASISNQRVTAIAGWGGSSSAVAYQSSSAPYTGTKCAAVQTRGISGDGLYHAAIMGIGGNIPYTLSAWVKIPAAVTNLSLTLRWQDSTATIIRDDSLNLAGSLVVGQWTRITATFTSPANAVRLDPMVRSYAAHTPMLFFVDAVQVEQASFASTYFDASFSASGDFTYVWLGTSGQSTSEERASSVGGYSGYYSGGRIAWSSSEWSASGTKSLAIAGLRPNLDSFSEINPRPNFGNMGGKTYTFIANLRTLETFPTGADGRAWSINLSVNLSGGGQFQYNVKPTTTFAGVHEIKQSLKIRDDATTINYMRLYNGSPNAVNVYWDNLMIVEGAYTGDYVDGAKPFSKWDGTVQASTSVGYPQQFLDIAGKPAIDLVGTASVNNTGVADPYMARTFYAVYENTGNTANYNVCASYGVVGSQGFMVQTAGAGSNSMANRYDMPSGSFNGGLVFSNARTSKRHVLAVTANQGLTNVTGCTDGGGDVGQTSTPGTGWGDNRALTTSTAEIKSVRFLVFNAAHDRATRVAMSRYLGNKYGAPVA